MEDFIEIFDEIEDDYDVEVRLPRIIHIRDDHFPPWYLYLVVVEWLACLNDPESYAGGSIAARSVTHAGQVKGDKPDEKVPWSKE